MKKFVLIIMSIFLFSNSVNAQQHYNNYDNLWHNVEQFETKKLPKSALKIVDEIYTKAKKENNAPQITKALLYQSKYALTLEEDAQLSIINSFKKEIATSEFPTKNILESVLADLYWQYFQQNRYKFYNRTKTSKKVDTLDFRTWDLNSIFEEIHVHFQNSLQNGLVAQQTDLKQFDAILNKQEDSKKFRPTLFDFLNHNALDFYKTSETAITQANYKFEIDAEHYLSNYKNFSQLEIQAKDSLSLQLNALKIYQNLIAFHIKTGNKDALISVDLERLKFVKEHAVFNEKEALFLTALITLKKEFSSSETSTLIDFEIATIYNNEANKYDAITNPQNQFKRVEALNICKAAIEKFPESFGAKKCKQLKQQILGNTLKITSEKNIPIGKYSKVLVNYKNIESLYITIYNISKNELSNFNKIHNNNEKIAFIKNLNLLNSFEQTLKTEHDFQEHATEIAIPPLTNGHYLIYASTLKNISAESLFATSSIQVTDLALVESRLHNNYTYQVVDRNNGKPIAGAKVNIKNYNTSRYNNLIDKNYITDKNGQLSFIARNSHRNVVISIKAEEDNARFGDYYFSNYNNYTERKNNTVIKPFIFTDRSIYRPSQTVFFKGIFIKKEGEKSAPYADELVTAALYNVNNEKISDLQLKTNEFGSVSGEFILPNNGLLGQYSIQLSQLRLTNQRYYFSVEEYKRPKFETTFKPVTETYKINDSVTINGTALAFAGSTITNAKVTYRVHRKVQYPRWYYWYRPYFTPSEPQEITHGETVTNSIGDYTITFKAIADKSINKENLPVFYYEVTADVTDINGETRSTSTLVKVGYHALIAEINVDATIDKNNKENLLKIETKNLNNQPVSAKGTLKIYKLEAPAFVLRKRAWNAPDYQLYIFEEFKNKFPHEAFSNEDNVANWKKGTLVFERDFNTKISSEIALKNIKKWESGKYIIELESNDKFGQLVTDKQLITVFSNNDKQVADNQLFTISLDKSSYKPNDIVILKVGSASKDISVTIDIEKDKKIIETKIIHLNNEIKQLEIPVTKNDLGGFAIHYSFTNFNAFENGTLPISVPYPIKELEIETLTFRDKLLPGQTETWSFKLKGNKGEKVAAEFLASMYDASLDQFKPHDWQFNPIYHPIYYSQTIRRANQSFGNTQFTINNLNRAYYGQIQQHFDALNWFGFRFNSNPIMIRGLSAAKMQRVTNGVEMEEMVMVENDTVLEEVETVAYGAKKDENKISEKETTDLSAVKIRKNFNETAFFYPHLKTDKDGNVSFSFTMPDALTQWKLQLLAHTKELASATKTLTTVTQKELMVLPNPPRFLREGDVLQFSSKISNLTKKALNGVAQLILTDVISGKDVTKELLQTVISTPLSNQQNFIVDAKGNTNVNWTLKIPDNIQAVQYKIIAKAGDFSDGEQNVLPVLSNRMLVTETLPMWVRSNETKTFTLDKLKNQTSTSLSHHKLTLEITSNPAWYAVQSLPYLMEYPYECSEQTFSRYYANALASHIANSNPRIQEVFNQWKSSDALISNLEKNQELKSIIIEETPWLRDAQSETEQKKRIALLFDLNKMNNELESTINKLKQAQFSNGGFPWFKGSNYPNRYITQYIATGFGHLNQLNVAENKEAKEMIVKAVQFLDDEILDDYNKLLKQAKKIRDKAKTIAKGLKAEQEYLEKNHLGHTQLHYLYMRSFYNDVKIPSKVKTAVDYYTKQSATYWTDFNLYSKGLIALIQHRNENSKITSEILKSLKENSITSEELGMYWKENTASYYWYQAPIETQALMIEVFSEIENEIKIVDELKVWLLKNKQTNSWKTTKATTEAVYALLLQGSDWLSVNETVEVTVGNKKIAPSKLENVAVEAGTGYYKTSWNGSEITPEMGEVSISKKGEGIAWGGLYWQYFEDLDKITNAKTPLQLTKKLFLKSNTDTGKELSEINKTSTLKIGDLITVRIELKVDRAMEFVHLKDMRASGLEPINVLSQYKWQDGLGYYESTKDAATNFFMERLPKGVYVFEYDLRANNAGNFSNGITTIQSMYAPEFSSHSQGVRIKVD